MTAAQTVLLVERSDALRDAIALRLRRAGCRVEAVGDARKAASLLQRSRFDVIAGDSEVGAQLHDHAGDFVVISVPLNLDALVRGVRGRATVDLDALQRFVSGIASWRDALDAPACTEQELALRGAMRHAIVELSGALEAAADCEPDGIRATILLAASVAAVDLAATRGSSRNRDH